MFMKGYYQNGYITHDFDRAKDMVSATLGILDWVSFDPAEIPVVTPQGPKAYKSRMALGWSGGVQVELIQPLNDDTRELYKDALAADPSDWAPRFHHIAVRRSSLEDLQAAVAATGLPLLMSGEVPGFVFSYVDFRRQLGHHVEMTWATDDMWAYNKWPAGRPDI